MCLVASRATEATTGVWIYEHDRKEVRINLRVIYHSTHAWPTYEKLGLQVAYERLNSVNAVSGHF